MNAMQRRLIFRGHAIGVAGQIRWPKPQLIPVQAASALPVTGGWSEAKAVPPARKLPFVEYRQAATRAFGDFLSNDDAIAILQGRRDEDQAPSRTEVSAVVKDLAIRGRVKIGLIQAALESARPRPGQELAIRPRDVRLERVTVDGHRLRIVLASDLLAKHDTRTKLAKAFAQPGFRRKHAGRFFSPAEGAPADPAQVPESGGLVFCTLVELMDWEGKPHPEATIDGHCLTIPDFGRLCFAEMFIGSLSRRLTMVRAVLGSPVGGTLSAGDVETNGVFWPA
jgi:hypothetical protein